MKKPTAILIFFIVAIFMTANDAFFTWLGTITHFSIWRQVIALVGILLIPRMFTFIFKEYDGLKTITHKYKVMFIFVAILSVVTFVIQRFNLIRIGYAWWFYFCGLPYMFMPAMARCCGWARSDFNKLFIFLGTFMSIGIFVDFLTGGMFTNMFLMQVIQKSSDFEDGRFCFLSTAPTIFSIYYCLCLMCCLHEFQIEERKRKKYIYLLLSQFFIFGSLFCGSRQTLVSLVIVFFFSLYSSVSRNTRSMPIIIIVFLTSILLIPTAKKYIDMNEGIEARYNIQDLREDTRITTWKRGFEYCVIDAPIIRILAGDGVSMTAGQRALPNEKTGRHFENTFFARVTDVGWILAIYLLLTPVFYIWKRKKYVGQDRFHYMGICLAYIFICCISPNGGSPTAQMAIFIALGLFIDETSHLQEQ